MKAGLTLKIKKCKFNIIRVNYLKMTYTTNGLEISKEKINDIFEQLVLISIHNI